MARKLVVGSILISALFLTACQAGESALNPTATPAAGVSPATLTICLGDEPQSLYLYEANSRAAQLVLQAIYDGPIDLLDGQPIPVILEALPSSANSLARVITIEVNPGDAVANTDGGAVTLQAGTRIFPAGCHTADCAITFDGSGPVRMDQTKAIFKLKAGVRWSDGQPLTAADSVFSFQIAAHPDTPTNHFFTNVTDQYRALDNLTIEWSGLPGLVRDDFENFFWPPLPKHAWGALSAHDLLSAEDAQRSPLGWGAYRLVAWEPGKEIQLARNPYYFRSDEGLPNFDRLIFRITDRQGDTNLANLKFDRSPFRHLDYDIGDFEGEISQNGCDLTTTTADMRDQMTVFNYLLNYYQEPAIRIFRSAHTETRFLLINLEGEDGISPQQMAGVRQALSQCIDRGRLVQQLSNNLFTVPGQVDLSQPQETEEPPGMLAFSPENADKLLNAAGWIDHDDKKETPRLARGVEGIPDGSALVMTLLSESGDETERLVSLIQPMLAECGIGLNTRAQPVEVLWNPAEEFSYFQSSYDLALISWKTPIANPCLALASGAIPSPQDGALGVNFSRFRNQRLDDLCARLSAPAHAAERQEAIAGMQALIHREAPLIPLYSYAELMTARKDFCSTGLSSGYSNELSGIEEFAISPGCP